MRHWTPAERQRQAELIKQWQPWKNSTGAKTIVGKAISAQNALQHGLYCAVELEDARRVSGIISSCREFLRDKFNRK